MSEHNLSVIVENLSYQYHNKKILGAKQPINLSLLQGKIHSIIGPNGSGKSTLLKLMAGVITASNGSVSCLGLTRPKHNQSIARQIAYIEQNLRFHWPIGVIDAVLLGNLSNVKALTLDKTYKQQAYELLDQLKIAHLAGLDVHQLSGGEQALVHVARILLAKPKLILADELTSNLDPYYQSYILDLLKNYLNKHKATLVWVAHDLSAVNKFADKVILMHQGQVIDQGEVRSVITQNNIQLAYQMNIKWLSDESGESHLILSP